jgi:hypothetical protein
MIARAADLRRGLIDRNELAQWRAARGYEA